MPGPWGKGGNRSIHEVVGLTGFHIANPKKYMSLKFYTQKINLLPQKIQELNTSVNTYLFHQTDFKT